MTRILVHDYAGHPFQVQLSRHLARRGHRVRHAYCASLVTTPRGALTEYPDDPSGFDVNGLSLGEPLAKYSFVKRWWQENAYGRLVSREVERFRPDVVLSGNTPLDAQRRLLKTCRQQGVRFVYWVQDLLGVATKRLLREKMPVAGAPVGWYYENLERRLLRKSDAAVVITEDFVPMLHRWNVKNVHVIENWGPLLDVPVRPKDNAWACEYGLEHKTCLLYSGTLGLKHNPELLLALAERFRKQPGVRVVVVSQGLGADWLEEQKHKAGLNNLILLGFQPFEVLPDVLGTADVLLGVLEKEAGVFSVPSKVLTYFCAGRPTLLAAPPENLAARLVRHHEAGLTVPSDDQNAFVQAAQQLVEDETRRRRLGKQARRYAENTFDISRITDDFEEVIDE